MKIKFTKMHGLGNDFILVDCLNDQIKEVEDLDIVRKLCDRKLGIGADQILILYPSKIADYRMKIFNADGSEVEMCGNGIRCLARYIKDTYNTKDLLEIETLGGIISPELKADLVVVDMGVPELLGSNIPVNLEGKIVSHPLNVDGTDVKITCVSMGNPHCVTFWDNIQTAPLENLGPKLEKHELFPNRINVEFIQVLDRETIRMRVWERGTGITMACGTGACASAVSSILNGYTDRFVTVVLDGGDLEIEWRKDNNRVYMTGPAVTSFSGEVVVST